MVIKKSFNLLEFGNISHFFSFILAYFFCNFGAFSIEK